MVAWGFAQQPSQICIPPHQKQDSGPGLATHLSAASRLFQLLRSAHKPSSTPQAKVNLASSFAHTKSLVLPFGYQYNGQLLLCRMSTASFIFVSYTCL